MYIQPYQELGSGMRDFFLEGSKMIWTGCLTHEITKLQPEQLFEHEIGFCFLAAGSYRFVYYCTDTQSKETILCRRPHMINVFDSRNI